MRSAQLCLLAELMLVALAQESRKIIVNNMCPEAIRLGFTGGRLNSYSEADCDAHPEILYWSPAARGCFFKAPFEHPDLASNSHIEMSLSKSFLFENSGGGGVTTDWSGTLWGATGCDGSGPDSNGASCDTAVCFESGKPSSEQGRCSPSTGPQGPVTKAEFTLQPDATDFYDVSSLDGVNLPISIAPLSGTLSMDASVANSGPYWCGSAGSPHSHGALSPSTWEYDVPAHMRRESLYVAFKDGGANAECDSDDDCHLEGEMCGFTNWMTPKDPVSQARGMTSEMLFGRCGRLLGIATFNGVCKLPHDGSMAFPDSDDVVGCKKPVGNQGLTRQSYYGCEGSLRSGYQPDDKSGHDTCGCASVGDWKEFGINAHTDHECYSSSAIWKQTVLANIAVVKKAAPTTYSYPYDDVSSTFQCSSSNKDKKNTQGYIFTFCPGGVGIGLNQSRHLEGSGLL
mmetsp:Transcript_35354/g.77325  ORF Transcript_35354/g.77325 Transcript_35354/m.77325 type:complete len:456 (+) Transcript_35354:67-1434(+)